MKRFLTLLLLNIFLCGLLPAQTVEPLPDAQKNQILNKVIAGYSDWGRVELNGKLSCELLPMSVTARVYMEKNKLIRLSLRAPLVGEAARIELNNDSLVVANKLNRCYAVIPMAEIKKIYPNPMTDLQNILLGRITIMGKGQLRALSFPDVNVFKMSNGIYSICPVDELQPDGFFYNYTVTAEGSMSNIVVISHDSDNLVVAEYEWGRAGAANIIIGAVINGKEMQVDLDLESPKFGATPMEALNLSNLTKSDLRKVLSF
ncbi:MAG: DUF4292 domain-containing protein [Clostridium sp.]|nr:DUF4292 domain-containing protein [Prevotella sp.]MCM1429557.1 DUF4292 domain-containing protein [Clostridium sp.]MCM1476036.1 DUF4292 domain-containing protein [Muribaculaceae bacterium]